MRKNTLSPRPPRLLAAVVVLGLVGALSGLAAAGSPASATPTAAATFTPDPIPAEILGSNVPVPVPASVITETDGWLVSDGFTLVAVYAGSAGNDPTQGRIVIVRQDLRSAKQTVKTLDAGPTGALTIPADAPTGAAVETSAQTGVLPISTSKGATLKLNLTTNTISPT